MNDHMEADQRVSALILPTVSHLCQRAALAAGWSDHKVALLILYSWWTNHPQTRSQSTAPLPVLLPWSEFTNSKANGSRVPKFNLINTLCGDLQQPNVLLDRCTVRSAYSTPLEVLSYTETQFWICPESQKKKRLRLQLSIYVVTIKITSGSRLWCDG